MSQEMTEAEHELLRVVLNDPDDREGIAAARRKVIVERVPATAVEELRRLCILEAQARAARSRYERTFSIPSELAEKIRDEVISEFRTGSRSGV